MANTTLVRNLEAYLFRYPHDQKRIFNIVLREIEKPPKIDNFTCAEPNKEYRARLCFIVNLMSPKLWEECIQKWKSDAYFIIETNPDAIALSFQTHDLTGFIRRPGFNFFLGYQGEDVIAPLQRVLRQTAYAGKLYLSQVLYPNLGEGVEELYVDYATHFNDILRKTVDHVFFNFGHIDDSIEGLRATFQNSARIKTSGGITEIEGIHKGKPFVVVGAGPSLDHDLDLLVQNQDKFIIVAVDASVKPLLKAGCRVDYAASIERYGGGAQVEFLRDLPKDLETELVAYPVVHRDVLSHWPGTVRFAYRNYAWFAYFERNWPMGILESGGSASHLATRLALHLGASDIFLIGCDMTYEQNPDGSQSFRSHCKGTPFPEWDRYKSEDEIRSDKEFCGFYDVEANDGSQAKTHTVYHQWAKEYSSMVVTQKMEGRLYSTSAKGVKTPRVTYVPFKEVCEAHSKIDIKRITPGNWRPMAKIGHETLLENLRGIDALIHETRDSLGTLLNNIAVKKPELLELAQKCLYEKLAHDTLFTAFIIQNSAMEFFRTENKVFAVPEGPLDDENYPRRVAALYNLFSVLVNISEKTVQVVELAVKGEL